MAARTEEISSLTAGSQGNVNRSVAKRLIARAAGDMDQYVARMEAELPLFGKNFNEGMDAFLRAAQISVEIQPTHTEQDQARESLRAMVSLLAALSKSERSIQEFRETVTALPRMTTTLNKSKRKVVSVLDRLIEELRTGRSLIREAERLARDVLREGPPVEDGG